VKGLEPFGLVEGRLLLEGVDLGDVAAALDGRPAWVISTAAVRWRRSVERMMHRL